MTRVLEAEVAFIVNRVGGLVENPRTVHDDLAKREECVVTRSGSPTMQMEMKYLRLRTPVELGSRFDDWEVSWLGGWSRHSMHYLVMVVRIRAD